MNIIFFFWRKKTDKVINRNKAVLFVPWYICLPSLQEIFYQDKCVTRKWILKYGNWKPGKIYFSVMLITCVKIKEIKVA